MHTLEDKKMLVIKIIDTLSNIITEIFYMVACGLYMAWQYRALIFACGIVATVFFLGLYGYCLRIEGILF